MSTVYLHVGQCGLQIGKEFWKDAAYKAVNDVDVKHVTFSSDEPRCLFIDSERKVIQKFIEETRKSKILKELRVPENSIRCRKGCGSNWAMGYHGLGKSILGQDLPKMKAGFGKFMVDQDSSMLDVCLEAIRMKVEKCDSFSGFLCINSLAGGTGSGWGARLSEELCNHYPTAYRLWNVIAPCSVGETPTQHYNQLLSISKLQECTDAVVIFQNDSILDYVARKRKEESRSYDELNLVISRTLQSLYLPISSLTSRAGGLSIGLEPWELIRSVAPLPSNKFLQTSYSEALVKDSMPDVWERLAKCTVTSFASNRSSQDRCIAALGICRGAETYCSPDIRKISTKLKNSLRCVDWNPFPVDMWWDEPKKMASNDRLRMPKSITLCLNCSSIKNYLQGVVTKAKCMYESGAYLHWYTRHGLSKDNFDEAFDVLKTIVDEY